MMKLRKVNFKNHPIFNDLELSFVDSSNRAYNTIIFAGENGVGKSILLNTLFQLIKVPTRNEEIIKLLGSEGSYEFELTTEEVNFIFKQELDNQKFDSNNLKNKIFTIKSNINNSSYCELIHDDIFGHKPHIGLFSLFNSYGNGYNKVRSIYLDVEINFQSKRIDYVTSKELDRFSEWNVRSNKNMPSEVKQLLIDLFNQDNAIIAQAVQTNPSETYQDIKDNLDLKINRFKMAFEKMIDNKVMAKVDVKNSELQVIFKDLRNDQEILIDEMSSGEKQIIYRGAFLLQNQKVLDNPVVFFDEPEISLHPDWQIKILRFYKDILTNPMTQELEAQLFVVTHSPFILHNTNPAEDKVIILERNQQGYVVQKQNAEFYNYTYPELIQAAFKLPQEMFTHDKNVIYVEGKTDEQYLKKALEVFEVNATNLEISYIGKDSNDKNSGTGEGNLEKAVHYLRNNHTKYSNKFCVLYDCDVPDSKCKPELEVPYKLIIRKHKLVDNNRNIKKGIENLLVFPSELNLDEFYLEKIIDSGCGKENKIYELKKAELANIICSYSNKQLKDILQNVFNSIKPIIDELEQV